MNGQPREISIQLDETLALRQIIADALDQDFSLSLWRLPDSEEKNLIVCTTGASIVDELSIEDSVPGFLITPFDLERPRLFLRADQSYVFLAGKLTQASQPIEEQFSTRRDIRYHIHKDHAPVHARPEQSFIKIVSKALEAIRHGRFEKVVPSRSKEVALPPSFEPLDLFQQLCDTYPHAFISLSSTPQCGTWIGASPELLVSVDANQTFRTMAVAGTQKLSPGADPRNVAWTQKEIEEQAMVSRYIINCFKQIRLREFTEHGPKTWTAGHLIHLRTDFEVDMGATNFPQLGTVMTKLLHPTSAVCGMPMEEALEFLDTHEGYDRQLYAGYLGPVNHKQASHLFVNLRCMQLQEGTAILYAGAGVTEDSNPEKEWEETEMKMNTLLQILQA
ncbi:MAG: chorismate-binding protein [Cyclobacteriaceae bacterium]